MSVIRVWVVALLLVVVGPPALAGAHWTGSGNGAGSAHTAGVVAPLIADAGDGAGTLRWTRQASFSGGAPASALSYVVERAAAGTTAYAEVTGGGCAGPLPNPTASCTDTSAEPGTWTYRVVARAGSWSDPSNAITLAVGVADTTAPEATAVTALDPTPTNATSVRFAVSFSEPVTGVDATDFTLVRSGVSASTAITGVSGSGAERVVTVAVPAGTGGTVRLDLLDDDTVLDAAGIPLAGPGTTGGRAGDTYVVDRTAPTGSSIALADASPTAASEVRFTVTFSEAVTGVGAADFALAGTATAGASITAVTGAGTTWTVTVAPGQGSGTLGLNLLDDDTVLDAVGNPLGGTRTGPAYTLDRTAPSIASIVRAAASPTTASSVAWTVTYSEAVTGVVAADFGFTYATGALMGASITSVTQVSSTTYTVTAATGLGDGTLTLRAIDRDLVRDAVGTPLGGMGDGNGAVTGPAYTIDRTPPAAPVLDPEATWQRATFDLSGTAEPGSTVVVREGATTRATVTASAGGTWTATLTAQPAGTHTYAATATDAAGNTSVASATVTVQVDATAPTVTATLVKTEGSASSTPGVVRQGGTYRVLANVTEAGGSGVGDVTAALQTLSGAGAAAAALAPCSSACTLNGTTYSYVGAVQTVTSPLAAGTRSWSVTVADVAGNPGTTGTVSATVDNTAPTASAVWTTGDQDGLPAAGESITLDFSEPIEGTSLVATWPWSWTTPTGVQVRLVDGGGSTPDTLEVRTADGATLLPYGSVGLGTGAYVTGGAGAYVVFGTTGTPSTLARDPKATHVTFGARGTGTGTLTTTPVIQSQTVDPTITWRIGTSSTAYDAAGNRAADSTVSNPGVRSPKVQF